MATTPNFGWTTPNDTDYVKDGASAIRTLGNAIDASMADLEGGTTGQVLSKNSNTDMDFVWVTPNDADAIQNTIVDAKGDLITATAADTPARLAVGTNGQVLTADSTAATGLKWAAAGGGKLKQIVTAEISTQVSITTGTYTDTNITATITPTANDSKILVIIQAGVFIQRSADGVGGYARLVRGSTTIWDPGVIAYVAGGGTLGSTNVYGQYIIEYLDSPATTSATTYKVQAYCTDTANSGKIQFQTTNQSKSFITLLEIGA